jgi:hypothetical protein
MKNLSPEDKIYKWMTQSFNFTMDRNFNEAQIQYA